MREVTGRRGCNYAVGRSDSRVHRGEEEVEKWEEEGQA